MNKLYYGDNLEVLRKYVRDETIDLCYIDPPFNSKRNYNQIYNNIGKEDVAQAQAFIDTWTWDDHAIYCYEQIQSNANGVQTSQSVDLMTGLERVLGHDSLFAYLVNMNVRIAEIHRALKPTGSFYLHCDPTASHYLKLVCDAIFVPQGGEYRNEIIWRRSSGFKRVTAKKFPTKHDIILYFAKSEQTDFHTQYQPHKPEYVKRFKPDADGRLHRTDVNPTKGGRRTIYLDEVEGDIIDSVWTDIFPINPAAAERLGYPTQKPESLLERIIATSSNEGDTILDAFCGCGTTIAVAERMKRRWVGIDITYQSISLILRRLAQISGAVEKIEIFGIPRDIESARALRDKRDDRVRKEFEKWAILTYSNNSAIIHEKKGADAGIDGIAYFAVGRDDDGDIKSGQVIFSVKSGKVSSRDIRDLRGVIEREGAAGGVFLTLEDSTEPMRKEAKQAGRFEGEFATFDRIQIVTVQQILDGEKLTLPAMAAVTKKARTGSSALQNVLFGDE